LRLTSVSFSGATAGRNLVKFCFRFLSRRAEAEAEVQATGTQRETDAGMATRGPATVSRSVRALGAAIHDLRTGRHEPDEPRGSRPDLWGAAGEIPAAYPATHWSSRLLAAELGLSHVTIVKVWKKRNLQPWRSETFKFSTDPET